MRRIPPTRNRASWRDLLPRAVLLAFGTEVIHLAVVFYLAPRIGRSSELYGTLGAATVILLWLYLLARMIVAAAFLNAALWENRSGNDGESGTAPPAAGGI